MNNLAMILLSISLVLFVISSTIRIIVMARFYNLIDKGGKK